MLMPTAMKNRPSSKPLKGSMSASSSLRYSLSASSTPARKGAQRHRQAHHHHQIRNAHHQQQRAAVKISGVRLLAIQRSGAQQRATAEHDGADHADDLQGLQQPRLPNGRRQPRGRAQQGSSARMGMAATSWNSRIEKPAARCWCA